MTAHAVHFFHTSGEAYDACQCRDDIENGDVLVIVSERVVGVADTWPVAVTLEAGKLHTPAEGFTVASALEGREAARGVDYARLEAARLGFELRA